MEQKGQRLKIWIGLSRTGKTLSRKIKGAIGLDYFGDNDHICLNLKQRVCVSKWWEGRFYRTPRSYRRVWTGQGWIERIDKKEPPLILEQGNTMIKSVCSWIESWQGDRWAGGGRDWCREIYYTSLGVKYWGLVPILRNMLQKGGNMGAGVKN